MTISSKLQERVSVCTWEGLSGRPQAAKAVRGAALGWERHLHCSPQHSQAHSWAEVSLSSGSV